MDLSDNQQLYAFPGNIKKAEVHQLVNTLGQDNKDPFSQVVCACCGKVSKCKNVNWLCLTRDEGILVWGGGLPQYFSILKLNIIVLLLVSIFYCLEFITSSGRLCNNLAEFQFIVGNISCLTSNSMSITTEIVLKQIFQNLKYGKFIALIIMIGFLVVFYVLISFRYLSRLSSGVQGKFEKIHDDLPKRSLVFLHLGEQLNEQDIKQIIESKVQSSRLFQSMHPKSNNQNDNINSNNSNSVNNRININIENMFRIQDYSKLANHFEKCIDLYEKLSIKQRDCIPYTNKDISDAKDAQIKLQEHIDTSNMTFKTIITFSTKEECQIARYALKRSPFFLLYHYLSLRNHHKYQKKFTDVQFLDVFDAPNPKDIQWKNIGSSVTQFIQYYLLSILIIIGFGLGLAKLLYTLIQMQSTNDSTSTSSSKSEQTLRTMFSEYGVSLGLLAIEKITLKVIQKISDYCLFSSRTNQLEFQLRFSIIFILLYYVSIPCFLFFLISDSTEAQKQQDKIARTASFLNEILTQLVLSFVMSIFDYKYIYQQYKIRKVKQMYEKTRIVNYTQIRLNQLFQKLDFNLEKRIILLFKLLAFSGFFVFMCPYSCVFLLPGLVLLYFLDKLLLTYRYSLYNYRNSSYLSTSATLMTSWMFLIVTTVYILTESETISFTLGQGIEDAYSLPKKYYVSVVTILILGFIAHIIIAFIYPYYIRRQKIKRAMEAKLNQSKIINLQAQPSSQYELHEKEEQESQSSKLQLKAEIQQKKQNETSPEEEGEKLTGRNSRNSKKSSKLSNLEGSQLELSAPLLSKEDKKQQEKSVQSQTQQQLLIENQIDESQAAILPASNISKVKEQYQNYSNILNGYQQCYNEFIHKNQSHQLLKFFNNF